MIRRRIIGLSAAGALALAVAGIGGPAFASNPPPNGSQQSCGSGSLGNNCANVSVTIEESLAFTVANSSITLTGANLPGTTSSNATAEQFTVTTDDAAGYVVGLYPATDNGGTEVPTSAFAGSGGAVGYSVPNDNLSINTSLTAGSSNAAPAGNDSSAGGGWTTSSENNVIVPASSIGPTGSNGDQYNEAWSVLLPNNVAAANGGSAYSENFEYIAFAN